MKVRETRRIDVRFGWLSGTVTVEPSCLRRPEVGVSSLYYAFAICSKAHVKRLLERIKLALYHKRLKTCLIRHTLSDPMKPVCWEAVKPMYAEIDAIREETLAESKCLAEALHLKWQALRELWKLRHIGWRQYEGAKLKLGRR